MLCLAIFDLRVKVLIKSYSYIYYYLEFILHAYNVLDHFALSTYSLHCLNPYYTSMFQSVNSSCVLRIQNLEIFNDNCKISDMHTSNYLYSHRYTNFIRF